MYLMLTDDELIGSDIFSSPRRFCIDLLSQNSSRFRNMSVNLDGSDYEILNILEEMPKCSKESESALPELSELK